MHNEHSSRQALINPQDEIAFIAMYAGFVVVFSQSTNLKHVQLQVLAKENGRRTGASYASASMILSKRRKIRDAGCSHRVSKSGLSGFQPTGLRWSSHFGPFRASLMWSGISIEIPLALLRSFTGQVTRHRKAVKKAKCWNFEVEVVTRHFPRHGVDPLVSSRLL